MFLSSSSVLLVAAVCIVSLSTSEANEVEDRAEHERQCPWTGPKCIDDCNGRQDGRYQSSRGCSIYATCRDQNTRYYGCPAGKVWDDYQKTCIRNSTSCYCYDERETCTTTGRRCISSCDGLPDGDYQSCHGCSVYVSCGGGLFYDYRPCAHADPPLQWDDRIKRCLYKSKTCSCRRDNEPVEDQFLWSQILKK